jgi:hypothetical protein
VAWNRLFAEQQATIQAGREDRLAAQATSAASQAAAVAASTAASFNMAELMTQRGRDRHPAPFREADGRLLAARYDRDYPRPHADRYDHGSGGFHADHQGYSRPRDDYRPRSYDNGDHDGHRSGRRSDPYAHPPRDRRVLQLDGFEDGRCSGSGNRQHTTGPLRTAHEELAWARPECPTTAFLPGYLADRRAEDVD